MIKDRAISHVAIVVREPANMSFSEHYHLANGRHFIIKGKARENQEVFAR